jgi:cytidylate kinase
MPYRNITISGLPGGGSTTLLNLLKDELQFEGWKGFSGGEFMRAYALQKGLFQEHNGVHHDASHYDDAFDRKVDMGMREKLQDEEKWILESWLSGFLAQGVPGVLKVLVYCSDDAVKIDRVVNRDQITVDEAKENIFRRYTANSTKWIRLYAEQWQQWVVAAGKMPAGEAINFWDPRLYDLAIDTYSSNKQETLQRVLDTLKNG